MGLRSWTNPKTEHHRLKGVQRRGYASGSALITHTRVAHNGEFVQACPACNEIKTKQDGVNVK